MQWKKMLKGKCGMENHERKTRNGKSGSGKTKLTEGRLLVPQWSEPTPWTRPQMPPGPKTSLQSYF